MTTLAVVRMGTGVAPEICKLFDNVINWKPGLEFDAIHFEGGSDIHPSMYGVKNTHSAVGNTLSNRDEIELQAGKEAIAQKALIIGSCRGAQLACALAGGKLVQDVTNHTGGGHIVASDNGLYFRTTTVHHQQMYPWEIEHELLAWSADPLSNHYFGDGIDPAKVVKEPEAVYFPKINALGFQWHPEWAISPGEIEFTVLQVKNKLKRSN